MAVVIGTSGWQYRDWRGRFYPQQLPQRLWLEHYAEHFATVESNNAFYRLPELETFQKWHQRTPEDFRWAVKASRFLTHIKRLREPAEPVARLMSRAVSLQERLDVILLQLPPTLKADTGLLRDCLAEFPPGVRVAVEPRHETWWTDEVRALLERYGAALCWADRLAETYGDGEDVLVYFNNDPGCAAVADAVTFADAVRRAGRTPTRVPTPEQASGAAWPTPEAPPRAGRRAGRAPAP